MISEILYENRRASVTTQRLVTALLSQISNTPYGRVLLISTVPLLFCTTCWTKFSPSPLEPRVLNPSAQT